MNTGTYTFPTGSGAGYADGYAINPANSSVTRNVSVSDLGVLTGTGDLSGKSQTVYAIPSADEWYKAAYYSPNQGGPSVPGYWTYATQSNEVSISDTNYNDFQSYTNTSVDLKAVGSYEEKYSYYGTFDQNGNLFEWNDVINGDYRGVRGGAFDYSASMMPGSARPSFSPDFESHANIGFRISSLITSVPEPGTYGMLAGAVALLGAIALRRRPRRQ